MKITYYISVAVSALFLILSTIVLVMGISNQSLQIDVQNQQGALQTLDEKEEDQRRALQTLDEKEEKLQQALQAQRKEIQKKQQTLQEQEEKIKTGNQISQQIGPNLLRDMAASAVKNEKMKALLAKHGYNVQVK